MRNLILAAALAFLGFFAQANLVAAETPQGSTPAHVQAGSTCSGGTCSTGTAEAAKKPCADCPKAGCAECPKATGTCPHSGTPGTK